MLLHGASDLDQRCLKTRSSEDGCTFPPNIDAPAPKITPKPQFGGSFNAKPMIHGTLRKSHVYGATKLKCYSYIHVGIDKYFRCIKIFTLGASGQSQCKGRSKTLNWGRSRGSGGRKSPSGAEGQLSPGRGLWDKSPPEAGAFL